MNLSCIFIAVVIVTINYTSLYVQGKAGDPCNDSNEYSSCGSEDSNECIAKDWWCDGHVDCDNGADESDCSQMICKSNEFKCQSGLQCIPQVLKCDKTKHCLDGSDEVNCQVERECLKFQEFDCNSNGQQCINFTKVCNGIRDCENGLDEAPGGEKSNCIIDHCAIRNGDCSHTCNNYYTNYRCSCPNGYKLISDNRTCVDINECLLWPPKCSQKCVNSISGYQCSCDINYQVNPSNKNQCLSIAPRTILLSAKGGYLYRYNISSSSSDSAQKIKSQNQFQFFNGSMRPVLVHKFSEDLSQFVTDVRDPNKTLIVLTVNTVEQTCQLYAYDQLNFSRNESDNRKLLYSTNDTLCKGLSYDWLRKLVYWSTELEGRIYVTNITHPQYSTSVVLDGLSGVRSLVVDPIQAKLYWVDRVAGVGQHRYQINTMFCAGESRRVVVASGEYLREPLALTLDLQANRLYWSDRNPGSISFVDLDKTDIRHLLIENKLLYPYHISVFDDKIYWSDWRQNHLISIDKNIGYPDIRAESFLFQPYQIVSESLSSQPLPFPEKIPCLPHHHKCSHICVPNDPKEYSEKCLCPLGMQLVSNQLTCQESVLALIYPVNTLRNVIIIAVCITLGVTLLFSVVLVSVVIARKYTRYAHPHQQYSMCATNSIHYPERSDGQATHCHNAKSQCWFKSNIIAGDLRIMFKCPSASSQLSELLKNDSTNTSSFGV